MTWKLLFNIVAFLYVLGYLLLYGRWEFNWWKELLLNRSLPKRRVEVRDLFPDE